jgi:hypothetical protein
VTVSRAAFGQNVWGAFMKRFVGFSHKKINGKSVWGLLMNSVL